MNYDRTELLDRLAAEYALGTMSERTRRRFAKLRVQIAAAEQAAQAWEQRLARLACTVPEVPVPSSVWDAVDRRTGAPTTVRRHLPSGWRAWFTPALGFAFGVVITVALFRLFPQVLVPIDELVQARGQLPASYVGLLTDSEGQPVILASSTRHGQTLSVKILRKIDVPPGKLLQLWALPKEGNAFALGIIPGDGKGRIQMPDTSEKLLFHVTRLAVSVEDSPATEHSVPAPFIVSGHCVKLW
jgi:anti-sigma-K factor RskA